MATATLPAGRILHSSTTRIVEPSFYEGINKYRFNTVGMPFAVILPVRGGTYAYCAYSRCG